MKDQLASRSMILEPNDTKGLASLCGKFDEHLHQIEKRLNIKIHNRGNIFSFYGDSNKTLRAERILTTLYKDFLFTGKDLTADQIHLTIGHVDLELSMIKSKKTDVEASIMSEKIKNPLSIKTKTRLIKAHGANQQKYVGAINAHVINFGGGPAGTGKTYLAVACAV